MATAYWEDRVKLAQRAIDRRDNILINKLSGSFDRINRQLNNDIGKIISTYTRKTGLTPEQAFQYLNEGLPQNVRNELLAKIQTVTSARERGKLETIMRTDRYQDRITRMDAIKADTRIALTKNAEVQIGEVTNHLKKTAQESYARSMFDIQKASGYAFSPHGVSADSINKILRTSWSGSTYSSRIWKAKDVMASNLDSVMTEMFSMGKLSDKTLKDLQGAVSFDKWKQQATSKFKNETQYAKYNVQRLIRTETNYVANAADAEAYEECEIEKYEFIAVLDGRTSPMCQQHDGKVYSMDEKEEGVNFPPLHPFCRSSVAPSLDSVNRSELQRRARDPETGKNVLIPADMNYNEWKVWVADGSPDIDGWRESKYPVSKQKEIAPQFVPAKTNIEAQKYLKEQLGINADYARFGVNEANNINKALFEARSIVGEEGISAIQNVYPMTKAKGRALAYYSPGEKAIYTKYYRAGGSNTLIEKYKSFFDVGWVSTNNPMHLIRHEIGHAINQSIIPEVFRNDFGVKTGLAESIQKMADITKEKDALKRLPIKLKRAVKYSDYLSDYGMSNTHEFIAESYAEYANGNPRETASKVMEILLKGVKK